jgi:queuine tRNA-ribosyltransferase
MFGIVQGACFPELRKQSADFLTQLPFDGFAIGGLAVGESKSLREDFTEMSADLLPKHLPRYLMGVGTPIDILEAVHRGVDMFDCILPTALAQRGVAFTTHGKLQLRRSVYKFAENPLDSDCTCTTCQTYSRAYLHHLIKAEETLGWHLLGVHNLMFYRRLMKEMREAILEDRFLPYYQRQRVALVKSDEDAPVKTPKPPRAKARKSLVLGDYEVHFSPNGFASIRQKSSGEVMHSVNAPEVEANRLYIEQSRFLERVQDSLSSEVVIWDVGLGAATNAMGVIHAYEKLAQEKLGSPLRPVHLISFENDLDSLNLALRHPTHFAHLRHAAPHELLRSGSWQSQHGPLRWTLLSGDFLETFRKASVPQIVFYDPFSYKADSSLWSWRCFQDLFEYLENHSTEIFTYSASTGVRAGLLNAGFYVAKGIGTGPKSETTIAVTPLAKKSSYSYLERDWFEKWSRSGAKYPIGVDLEEEAEFAEKLLLHAQLAATS